MLIHVNDRAAIDDLSSYLRLRTGAIVQRQAPHELEVSLLGSYSNTAMAKEIGAAVRDWKDGRRPRGCRVELLP